MAGVNHTIVASAAAITGITLVNSMVNQKPAGRVLVAGYGVVLLLSILDLFGGAMSQLASALALLALLSVLLVQFGPFANTITAAVGKYSSTGK